MKSIYIKVGVVVFLILIISYMLLPDQSQLTFMKEHKKVVIVDTTQKALTEKQTYYEAKVAAGDLSSETVNALADVYAAQGQEKKAAELMERYRAKHPDDVQTLDKLGILYRTLGRDDKFVEILEQEDRVKPSINVLRMLLDMYGTTHPEKSIKALREYITLDPDQLKNYDDLVYFLQITHQDAEAAAVIARFKTLYPESMTYKMTYPLVRQLIQEKKWDEAYADAADWIKHNPEPGTTDFAAMFLNAGRPDLTLKLLAKATDRMEKEPSLIALYVQAQAATDPKAAFKTASVWMEHHPNDEKTLNALASVFFAQKRFGDVAHLIAPYKDKPNFDPSLKKLYADALLASIKTEPENLPELTHLYEEELNNPATTPARKKELIWVMMDIGADEAAMPYAKTYAFQMHGDWVFIYESILKKLHKTTELAEFRDKYTHTVELTDGERNYFGYAYLSEGNKPEAARILTPLFEHELRDPNTTREQRKSILYSMLNLGADEEALHYARTYAFMWRGDWVLIYEAFLTKLHKTTELAEFRYRYVHSVKLTDTEKRRYAYIYLEQGNKAEGERLLWQLVMNAPPKNKDLQTLLFVWGVQPGAAQVQWLQDRAMSAPADEKVEWLHMLMNAQAYDQVVNVINAMPRDTRSFEVLKIYYSMFQIGGNRDTLAAELQADIAEESDATRLAFISKYALDVGVYDAAAQGYDKLLSLEPHNKEYLKNRGWAAYRLGDNSAALECWKRYYDLGGRDIHVLFTLAEMMPKQQRDASRPIYTQIVTKLSQEPELTSQDELVEVASLARLGRYQEADNDIEALMRKNPGDESIKLDYAEMLIDQKQYQKAESLLAEPVQPLVANNAAIASWNIDRQHILSIEPTVYPYEIVVIYDRPVNKLPEVKQMQKNLPAWIKAAYPGYDKLVLVSAQNTQLTFALHANDASIGIQELPAADKNNTDHQLAVRRQLLYARIEQNTDRTSEALERLRTLKTSNPQNVDVLTTLASAERSDGNRLVAVDLAQQAYNLEPQNLWTSTLLADLKKNDVPWVKFDNQWMHDGDNNQFISQLSAQTPVTRNFSLGATAENIFYNFKNLQRFDGTTGAGNGNSQRGRLDALYEFEDGPLSDTSLYLNPGPADLGIGEHVLFHDELGNATVFGEYKRSDWTYTERIANDATRNRVGAQQNYSPAPQVSTYLGTALSQYNLGSDDDVTSTVSLWGGVQVPVSLFNDAWVGSPFSVGYGLDAEYIQSHKEGINSDGDAYRLYPLISREVHSLNVAYHYAFDKSLMLDSFASYAYDRISGDSGPGAGVVLTDSLQDGLELQLRASEGISFVQGGTDVTTIGGYVLWRF